MEKLNIKKILQKVTDYWDKDSLKLTLTPYRDWGILIVAFFIFIAIASTAHSYLFIKIKNQQIFFEEASGEILEMEVLDTERLRSTVEFFDKKEETFQRLLIEKPSIIDPSL
ncbi:MAG: hypothetical protein BMS9Abin13_283 [Patescibacteria group bacterium]|nr:MAG: hypothetical protein BMS9Abin13_283 [Patescibacteria group bacterium]